MIAHVASTARGAHDRARLLPALLALAAVCAAPGAAAWGPQGHRTIGAIADRLLTREARAAVAQLLADDLDKFGNPSGRTTLEGVSVWADEIKGTPASRPGWHYDNIPVCGTEPRARYCHDGQCSSGQLERLSGVLADRAATPRERNEALKWVVHLVGDIHQPLHAADNADRGGNDVRVALVGVRTRGRESLHRAWDGELVRLALNTAGGQRPPQDLGALALEARRLAADAGQGTPESWASESNALARGVAYDFPGFVCGRAPQGIVILDAAYLQKARGVVRQRLLLAGARLADLLNRVLAQP
jgi:hypothetical protein